VRLDYHLDSGQVTGLLAQTGVRGVKSAVGAMGDGVDAIAADVERQFSARGWGATSRVRARMGRNRDAFVFLEGGAAWQEDHPDRPRPTLAPAVDRAVGAIEAEIVDRVGRLL